MEKKYKLMEAGIEKNGIRLRRIVALKDFGDVKKGTLGGYVESELNLSQYNNCWIYDKAKVYGGASIYENAKIYEEAEVYGANTIVEGNSIVHGKDTKICHSAMIFGNGRIRSSEDYIVLTDIGSVIDDSVTFYKSFNGGILVKSQWFEGNLSAFKKHISTTYSGKYKRCYYKAISLVKTYLK